MTGIDTSRTVRNREPGCRKLPVVQVADVAPTNVTSLGHPERRLSGAAIRIADISGSEFASQLSAQNYAFERSICDPGIRPWRLLFHCLKEMRDHVTASIA